VDAAIAKLSVNRLTVVPFMHPMFHRVSYSDVVNYNTTPQASFFIFYLRDLSNLCFEGTPGFISDASPKSAKVGLENQDQK
jgi:hypothetical protein